MAHPAKSSRLDEIYGIRWRNLSRFRKWMTIIQDASVATKFMLACISLTISLQTTTACSYGDLSPVSIEAGCQPTAAEATTLSYTFSTLIYIQSMFFIATMVMNKLVPAVNQAKTAALVIGVMSIACVCAQFLAVNRMTSQRLDFTCTTEGGLAPLFSVNTVIGLSNGTSIQYACSDVSISLTDPTTNDLVNIQCSKACYLQVPGDAVDLLGTIALTVVYQLFLLRDYYNQAKQEVLLSMMKKFGDVSDFKYNPYDDPMIASSAPLSESLLQPSSFSSSSSASSGSEHIISSDSHSDAKKRVQWIRYREALLKGSWFERNAEHSRLVKAGLVIRRTMTTKMFSDLSVYAKYILASSALLRLIDAKNMLSLTTNTFASNVIIGACDPVCSSGAAYESYFITFIANSVVLVAVLFLHKNRSLRRYHSQISIFAGLLLFVLVAIKVAVLCSLLAVTPYFNVCSKLLNQYAAQGLSVLPDDSCSTATVILPTQPAPQYLYCASVTSCALPQQGAILIPSLVASFVYFGLLLIDWNYECRMMLDDDETAKQGHFVDGIRTSNGAEIQLQNVSSHHQELVI